MNVAMLNKDGDKAKDITLNKELWSKEPNDAVLYNAIKLTRNSLKQGTHSTKRRFEVRGGGKKPWRQKGTGRARHGSIRSPIWVGGGVAFGPLPGKTKTKMNRKERALALKAALIHKYKNKDLILIESLELKDNKTKTALELLTNLKLNKEKTLILDINLSDNLILATRNLKNIILLQVDELNVLDIVNSSKMIITEKALKAIEEVLV